MSLIDLGLMRRRSAPCRARSSALLLLIPLAACSELPVEVTDTVTSGGSSGTTTIIPTSDSGSSGLDSTMGQEGTSGSGSGGDTTTTTDTDTDTDTDGPACGNGVREDEEQCDGDDLGGATCEAAGFEGGTITCNANCELETDECFTCGDGVINGAEQCDGPDVDGETCETQGFDGGGLGCDVTCNFDTAGCYACGDGNVDMGEACDGMNLDMQDCDLLGFDGGALACDGTCQFDTSGCYECGDGAIDMGEECDGMNLAGEDCMTQGFDGGTLACSGTCLFDVSGCTSDMCGDMIINGADQCEPPDILGGEDCMSLGFGAGTLSCTAMCTFDTSDCCGDGNVGAMEVCDGMAPPGASCVAEGFDGGIIDCAADCTLDTTGCYSCGDGTANPGEQCDMMDLSGATCLTLGFDGGNLACDGSCNYDTTGCYSCGDGTANPGEQCDMMDLGGGTCVTEGFDGGMLVCNAACNYDTSGCYDCGDGTIDPGESCDGVNLGGEDCMSQGFASGTLACDGTCQFDTSGCCSDGTVGGMEECDGTDFAGQTCEGLGMGFTGGSLACDAMCMIDSAGCTSLPLPTPGQVVINEIMKDPDTIPDGSGGEWIELYNPDGVASYQLQGCTLDTMANSVMIDMDLVIGPGGYVTLAETSMMGPGFMADFEWPVDGLPLPNGSATLELNCDGMLVDDVGYDNGMTFPDTTGAALSLDPLFANTVDNDDGANWCDAVNSYNGDFGSPGAMNPVCGLSYTIGFCRLQFPDNIMQMQGTTETVYGRVYAEFLTDQTQFVDVHPALVAEFGYGPNNTDPAVDGGWMWFTALPNLAYDDTIPPGEMNNDEYQYLVTLPAAGTYDYAYRFSGDYGLSFTYCDLNNGSSDGYDPMDAGHMVSMP